MTSRRHILVAGATGYLGGFVAQEFKLRGHFVRALARSPHKLDSMQGQLDQIVQGEVTIPQSIDGICDGVDVMFSSVGITRQKDKMTFRDVDYRGNMNLLDLALKARVRKFIYVSVLSGPRLRHLGIVKAHEDFVDELRTSGMDYTVVRPTGYFSDMEEFLKMAAKGRVFLVGAGHNRMNPIHGADLARVCVDALDRDQQEVDVGGPEIMSYREIGELAFEVLGKTPRFTSLPLWAVNAAIAGMRIFSKHRAALAAFFATAMTNDTIAPCTGTCKLKAHFEEWARLSSCI